MALRQELDLYVCLRPVRYFKGVPSPLKQPEKTDMVIFRENSEDIYAGIEWQAETEGASKVIKFLIEEMGVKKIRFPQTSGIGIKPVSREGTERLVRKAIQYAIANKRRSVTLVHKGNIMKFTEGAFRDWGYALAQTRVRRPAAGRRPVAEAARSGIVVKDVIADAFLQQILLRPDEYDVIATLNLNGDYISDALAAQVGGIGIAPGANISDSVAMFEATHGTAPKYAGKDYVNPGSLILSAEMMLRHMGWVEAADLIITSMEKTILDKVVTYDFARLMDGATQVSCSGFGNAMIERMRRSADATRSAGRRIGAGRAGMLGARQCKQRLAATQTTKTRLLGGFGLFFSDGAGGAAPANPNCVLLGTPAWGTLTLLGQEDRVVADSLLRRPGCSRLACPSGPCVTSKLTF